MFRIYLHNKSYIIHGLCRIKPFIIRIYNEIIVKTNKVIKNGIVIEGSIT